jgi:hypothetical protein
VFCHSKIWFLSLDGTSFSRPVPIGSILKLESMILHMSSSDEYPVLVVTLVSASNQLGGTVTGRQTDWPIEMSAQPYSRAGSTLVLKQTSWMWRQATNKQQTTSSSHGVKRAKAWAHILNKLSQKHTKLCLLFPLISDHQVGLADWLTDWCVESTLTHRGHALARGASCTWVGFPYLWVLVVEGVVQATSVALDW